MPSRCRLAGLKGTKRGGFLRAHTPPSSEARPLPSGKVRIFAEVVPAVPLKTSSESVLRFRYRTNAPWIRVNLGGYSHVHLSKTQGNKWRVAEIPRVEFVEDGVPMIPGDKVTKIRFMSEFSLPAGTLDIDSVQWVRLVR